ncbi:hypothetical protein FSW04_17150 [Baekduia soli]|uniref:Uncharacterized protein n=1 Tax=Baekduia soli TaxID=496014 RepID=A0A5B8U7P7_9ACTN|nr:hypothetical protein [Baekduia soli]QEC49133.1 hypothetical protein FSW04_17150 [Baekduia soli]
MVFADGDAEHLGAGAGDAIRTPRRRGGVVKLTREPHLNRRLDDEWDALRRLRDAGVGDDEILPRPGFAGHRARLPAVGETAVSGDLLLSGAAWTGTARASGWSATWPATCS